MIDEYSEGISFNDMELAHINDDKCFPGAPAQGTDYAKMGIRDYDQVYMEKVQADHERARREGSKG